MTSNQIALQQNRIKQEEVAETKRSNRAREKETRRKNTADIVLGTANTATNLISKFNPFSKGKSLPNDPSWYNLDPQMVKDTASISFDTPLGYKVENIVGSMPNGTKLKVHPGIMAITWIPTIGGDSQVGDISAIAAKNIYAYVRHANSGSRNYEATDLMMYLYAIDQAHSYHAFMKRLYSLLLDCKGYNRYYLNQLVRMNGCNPDDLRNNIASFRAFINSYAVRLNSFYAPNTLPLFNRHYWLNSGIYKDSPVKKSQEYMFVQESFGIYDDQNGKIKFKPRDFTPGGENLKTFEDLTFIGNQIIGGLINSEDAGIMSGDILKAYGNDKMIYSDNTPENYHVESIYSEEVLSQITNATILGDVDEYDIQQRTNPRTLTSEIYQGSYLTQFETAQDPNSNAVNSNKYGILCHLLSMTNPKTPSWVYPADMFKNTLINFYKDNPSNDEVMVSSRLIALPENIQSNLINPYTGYRANGTEAATDSTNWGIPVQYYGTEICTWAYVCTLLPDEPNAADVFRYRTLAVTNNFNAEQYRQISTIQKFDWAPVQYYINGVRTTENDHPIFTNDTFLGSYYDGANYASVPSKTIGNMHYTAVISELGIPMLGLHVRTR